MSSSSSASSSRRSSGKRLRSLALFVSHLMACLGGMVFATILFHGWILHFVEIPKLQDHPIHQMVSPHDKLSENIATNHDEHHQKTNDLAGLDCSPHGGPESREITQELVYWKDLPLDTEYISPLKSTTERQYLTFEPDGGG